MPVGYISRIQDDGAVVLAPRVHQLIYMNIDPCSESDGMASEDELEDEVEDEVDEDEPLTRYPDTESGRTVEELNKFDMQKGESCSVQESSQY